VRAPGTISLVLVTPTGRRTAALPQAFWMHGQRSQSTAYTHQLCWAWPRRNLMFRLQATVADASSRAAAKRQLRQLVQGQQLDLKIPVAGMRAKVDPSSPEGNGLAGLDGSP